MELTEDLKNKRPCIEIFNYRWPDEEWEEYTQEWTEEDWQEFEKMNLFYIKNRGRLFRMALEKSIEDHFTKCLLGETS